MNAIRRKELKSIHGLLEQAYDLLCEAGERLDDVKSDEEDAFDNLPDSLQESEQGERMQEAIGDLDNALSLDWDDLISEMMENIENAME